MGIRHIEAGTPRCHVAGSPPLHPRPGRPAGGCSRSPTAAAPCARSPEADPSGHIHPTKERKVAVRRSLPDHREEPPWQLAARPDRDRSIRPFTPSAQATAKEHVIVVAPPGSQERQRPRSRYLRATACHAPGGTAASAQGGRQGRPRRRRALARWHLPLDRAAAVRRRRLRPRRPHRDLAGRGRRHRPQRIPPGHRMESRRRRDRRLQGARRHRFRHPPALRRRCLGPARPHPARPHRHHTQRDRLHAQQPRPGLPRHAAGPATHRLPGDAVVHQPVRAGAEHFRHHRPHAAARLGQQHLRVRRAPGPVPDPDLLPVELKALPGRAGRVVPRHHGRDAVLQAASGAGHPARAGRAAAAGVAGPGVVAPTTPRPATCGSKG